MTATTAETCTIRPANAGDLSAMTELLGVLFSIEADFEFDEDAHLHGLALLLGDETRSRLMVAESGGEVCGMASVQLVVSTAQGALSGLVEDVVVKPEFRNCGVGRALMDAVTDWAVTKGATRVQLLADWDNGPALGFYEAIGFSQTQLRCLRKFPETS